MKLILTIYLRQYIQDLMISTYNQYKKLLRFHMLCFWINYLKSLVYFILIAQLDFFYNTDIFQVLNSYMWPLATLLDYNRTKGAFLDYTHFSLDEDLDLLVSTLCIRTECMFKLYV